MVRTATLALSSAALVATVSSFIVPSQPLGAAFSSASISNPKLSEAAAPRNSARSLRRGRVAMSSVPAEGGEVGGERYYGPTSKPLLDSVQSPADMKRFSLAELKQLAYELRWETLEVSEALAPPQSYSLQVSSSKRLS